ncbi:hypothetical protein GWK47_021072 [Chionoecetes opilio]|uniref:Uncharacterized protein n=1 Tax=Chionoecetes opilio TaxID=41210 RepID=A0A8J4XSI4_CHIOP|nr:hypothetical protein GWK47_021072 [Chionoecetes opilio]
MQVHGIRDQSCTAGHNVAVPDGCPRKSTTSSAPARRRMHRSAQPARVSGDIRMLNLSDLQGIEAEGRLTVFLSQVESCSEDLEERKRILMTRVDPPLALYAQNALSVYKFRSWDTLTYWLCEELTDNNVDRVLNSISEVKYDWLEDPQDFATKLKCKYAILEAKSKYPGEVLRRDKIIKNETVERITKPQ